MAGVPSGRVVLSERPASSADWLPGGEARVEAKQEQIADMQSEVARRELENYRAAQERLSDALESEDLKIVLRAIQEARESYKGTGKEATGDIQELLAGVIAGKFGDKKIPLTAFGEEPPVKMVLVPRPGAKSDEDA